MNNLTENGRLRLRWEKSKDGQLRILLNNFLILNTTAFEVLQTYKEGGVSTTLDYFQEKYPFIPAAKLQEDIQRIITQFREWNILVEQPNEPLPLAPSFMEEIESMFENQLSAPLHVACILTYSCNAQCPHCFAPLHKGSPELVTEDWKKTIDQLAEINIFTVTFTGGEPLLRTDLEDLVEYASQKGVTPGIDTNGYFLTKDKIETLVSAGALGFEISLDGSCSHIHDTFRGLPGSFKRVIEAISFIMDEQVDVGILTVVTTHNVDDILHIIDLLDDMGVRRHTLIRLRNVNGTESLEPDPEEYIELLKSVFQKQCDLHRQVIYPDLPALYYCTSIGHKSYEELKKTGCIRPCEAGIIKCAINPSGNVLPCNMSSVSVGNIRETPLKEIWRESPLLKQLRRTKLKQKYPCSECTLNTTCTAGCKALPSQMKDNCIMPDAVCFPCFDYQKKHGEHHV